MISLYQPQTPLQTCVGVESHSSVAMGLLDGNAHGRDMIVPPIADLPLRRSVGLAPLAHPMATVTLSSAPEQLLAGFHGRGNDRHLGKSLPLPFAEFKRPGRADFAFHAAVDRAIESEQPLFLDRYRH